jgi:V-type H+-transporting ATPase subunit E
LVTHYARISSAQSTLTNKSRLKLLQQREEHVQDLFNTARERISELSSNESAYSQFLETNILQGLLALLEPDVTIRVRHKDEAGVAKEAAERAEKQYEEISGRTVKVTVEGGLSDESYVSPRSNPRSNPWC